MPTVYVPYEGRMILVRYELRGESPSRLWNLITELVGYLKGTCAMRITRSGNDGGRGNFILSVYRPEALDEVIVRVPDEIMRKIAANS